ncbi:MAG TPA: chorismate synthase, partial [Smithellaceae bacterium]|nr:chorismate synthase [Smithellaceae bacterium]
AKGKKTKRINRIPGGRRAGRFYLTIASGKSIPRESTTGNCASCLKAVEIGDGCVVAVKKGSQVNDPMDAQGFTKNSTGGILAGIATGQDMILRVYCKPIPSIALPQQTVDSEGQKHAIKIQGRHDICVLPRIVPVCEAMVCLVLADHWLRQKAVRL